MNLPKNVPICLFCKSISNSFQSAEHVFPESLGNREKTLPKGVVCDRCNNGVLSVVDAALTSFGPIAFMKTMNGVRGKDGSIPTASLANMKISNSTGSNIKIELDSLSSKHYEKTEEGFRIHMMGPQRMTDKTLKLIARALYKIGLELMYLDHGREFVHQTRFDEIRDIVLGRVDFSGYLIFGANATSVTPGVTYRFIKSLKDGQEFAFFEFNYLFLKIMFDLERRKVLLESGSNFMDMTILKFDKKGLLALKESRN